MAIGGLASIGNVALRVILVGPRRAMHRIKENHLANRM
jgi:hypothetical protein